MIASSLISSWLSTGKQRCGLVVAGLFLAFGQGLNAAGSDSAVPDVITEDFIVIHDGERLNVRIMSPSLEKLAPQPLLLLNFATDRQTSLTDELYGIPARIFLQHGQRVLSFDVPAHGERIDPRFGAGIDGLCAAFVAGHDPFKLFVADGKAVIDECVRRGWAVPGRVVVCGNSRSGYQALRLMAADSRISAGSGLAPVTDWAVLKEFAAVKNTAGVAALNLTAFAPELAGRKIYLAIGNGDRRVGTEACTRFAQAIFEAEKQVQPAHYQVRLNVVDDSPDHTLNNRWTEAGTLFLLEPGK